MIVGLTGGIATGKSTVAERLRTLGATVVDADQVSRDIVGPGSETLHAIQMAFGDSIINVDGSLNRDELGMIVRADHSARKRLESITHPHIRAEIARQVQNAIVSGAPAVFVEAALLVETGSAALYPDLWVVRCSHATQVRRLVKRNGFDQKTAEEWIATQMPVDQKAQHASLIIDNDADVASLILQTDAAYQRLMEQQPDPD